MNKNERIVMAIIVLLIVAMILVFINIMSATAAEDNRAALPLVVHGLKHYRPTPSPAPTEAPSPTPRPCGTDPNYWTNCPPVKP